jgi:hypothetical protein
MFQVRTNCRGWVPHEHPTPVTLPTIHGTFKPSAVDERLDDRHVRGRSADCDGYQRPPLTEFGGKDVEGASLIGVYDEFLAYRRGHICISVHVLL